VVWPYWHCKSRKAFGEYPDAYIKMNNKWWDGYANEKTVIMDDYRASLCTFQDLLRILDRYPLRVELKGACAQLSALHYMYCSLFYYKKLLLLFKELIRSTILCVIAFRGVVVPRSLPPTTSGTAPSRKNARPNRNAALPCVWFFFSSHQQDLLYADSIIYYGSIVSIKISGVVVGISAY
jgi:hypothetical protein